MFLQEDEDEEPEVPSETEAGEDDEVDVCAVERIPALCSRYEKAAKRALILPSTKRSHSCLTLHARSLTLHARVNKRLWCTLQTRILWKKGFWKLVVKNVASTDKNFAYIRNLMEICLYSEFVAVTKRMMKIRTLFITFPWHLKLTILRRPVGLMRFDVLTQ